MRDEHNRYGQPAAAPVPLTFDAFAGLVNQIHATEGHAPAELSFPMERISELLRTLPPMRMDPSLAPLPEGVVAIVMGVRLKIAARYRRAPR